MILTMMSFMAAVGRTFMYASSRLKKYSMRLNKSIRASLLARTSLIACKGYKLPSRPHLAKRDAHLQKDSNPCEYRICRWKYLWEGTLDGRFRTAEYLAIYHTDAVAEGCRECKQDIDSGTKPPCPFFRVVSTLRLIKVLYLSPKNGDDGTGRVTGLQLRG